MNYTDTYELRTYCLKYIDASMSVIHIILIFFILFILIYWIIKYIR